MFLFSHNKDQQ